MARKLLSLLLALVLVLSLCAPAFATEEPAETDLKQDAAEMLYLFDLFQGTGTDENGEPIFDLEKPLTRAQAVTMLVRLLGKEEEALEQNLDSPFTDVAEWARPYVGYAYAQGLTNGTGPTTYSGSKPVTATQYLTFLLRALGYEDDVDFQWNAAWELTDELGITNGEYGPDSTFLRGDAALVSCDALFVEVKDSEDILLDHIFADPEMPDYGVYVMAGFYHTALVPVLTRQIQVYQPLGELVDNSHTKDVLDAAKASQESSLQLDKALTVALLFVNRYSELTDYLSPLEKLQALNAPLTKYPLNASNCMDYLQLAANKSEDVTAALNELNELAQNFASLLGE